MIEYIYDAIRATSGEDISICALITDDDGENITDSCYLTLYNDTDELTKVYGVFDEEQWTFTIPAAITDGLCGRFWYSIGRNYMDICFKNPIYLI